MEGIVGFAQLNPIPPRNSNFENAVIRIPDDLLVVVSAGID